MHRMLRGLAGLSLACIAVAGCGINGETRNDGAITSAVSTFPDYLDPALAYSSEGWQALWLVYTPLLTYAHAEGAAGSRLIPGLARTLPTISADGRTYRLTLRRGLRYSDGRPVRASDFEHTVKRILAMRSGAEPYFDRIAGAAAYLKAGRRGGDISGIVTDDRSGAITIRLTKPYGSFSNVLALDFAGLVPRDTPFVNQTRKPAAGVGPYRLSGVRVNRHYELVRVPGFDVPGLPKGKLDRISFDVIKDRARQTENTIDDKLDVMTDPPAPDEIATVRRRFGGGRYKEFTTNSTYFFFLNHRLAPFDRKAVREAVNYALDERALRRIFGGLLDPGCNFLPPGLAGYQKIDPCRYGDPAAAPDMARARALVRAAGATGDPVRIWGIDEPEPKAAVEYLADALNRIGLKAEPRIVSGAVYFQTIGSARTKAQIGFANYFEDFPRASNFFSLVDGSSIEATGNTNFGNVDDPQINATLDRANRSPDADAVAKDYAAVDRRLLDEAHVAPYGTRKLSVFLSERMNPACAIWHPVYNLDYSSLCLR